MSFSTDDAWTAPLRGIFETARQRPPLHENRYYGPYTTLLTYCFADAQGYRFMLGAPQAPPSPNPSFSHQSVNFVVYLVDLDAHLMHPVLIMEIKDDSIINTPERCLDADTQIRQRFHVITPACYLPRLWGLSLLGTPLRVYVADVNSRQVGMLIFFLKKGLRQ